MGHAAETQFHGPPNLSGARPGSSVIVLGAGLAGMLAAYELSKAGYQVRILEYQNRAGGRNWSLYGGDTYTELGGATQHVGFAQGNYLNPGPWRIPHHHRTLLHYCKQFGVALEPFIQFNHNAYVHSADAFGGRPQRYREVAADFEGNVAELLSKAINQKALDADVSPEDREKLLEALRGWGMLDKDMRYVTGLESSEHRGYDRPPGGGVNGAPTPSTVFDFHDVLYSDVWKNMSFFMNQEFQTTMFQPVGGMGMIGKAFARQVQPLITHNAKVTKITQDKQGVTVTYQDTAGGGVTEAKASFCVCTIPLGVLNQIDNNLSPNVQAAVAAVPYSNSVKIGLEFKRRFWEEDDFIYGGHSFTSQDIGPGVVSQQQPVRGWSGGDAGRLRQRARRVPPGGHDAPGTDRDGPDPGLGLPRRHLPPGVFERRLGRLGPGALDARLLRPMERGHAQGTLSDAGGRG